MNLVWFFCGFLSCLAVEGAGLTVLALVLRGHIEHVDEPCTYSLGTIPDRPEFHDIGDEEDGAFV